MDVLDRLEQELKTRSIGSPSESRSSRPLSSSSPLAAAVPRVINSSGAAPFFDTPIERLEYKLDVLAGLDVTSSPGAASITAMSQLRASYERDKRSLELAHSAQLAMVQERSQLALQRKDKQCSEALEKVNELNQGLRKASLAADERLHMLTLEMQANERRHREEVARLREHIAVAERESCSLRVELNAVSGTVSPLTNGVPSAATSDANLLVASMSDMWVQRVHELNAENERLTNEVLSAKTAQRLSGEAKAELQQQFATYRRVSEEQLAAAVAEKTAMLSEKNALLAQLEDQRKETEVAQRKCHDIEILNELLEARVRKLMTELETSKQVVAMSNVKPTLTGVVVEETPAADSGPIVTQFEGVQATQRMAPKKLPPPRAQVQ
jgi:hypothetical protein